MVSCMLLKVILKQYLFWFVSFGFGLSFSKAIVCIKNTKYLHLIAEWIDCLADHLWAKSLWMCINPKAEEVVKSLQMPVNTDEDSVQSTNDFIHSEPRSLGNRNVRLLPSFKSFQPSSLGTGDPISGSSPLVSVSLITLYEYEYLLFELKN